MSPEQLRAILKRLGMSQLAGARALGVTGRTVRRWIAGDPIPRRVGIALGMMLERKFESERQEATETQEVER